MYTLHRKLNRSVNGYPLVSLEWVLDVAPTREAAVFALRREVRTMEELYGPSGGTEVLEKLDAADGETVLRGGFRHVTEENVYWITEDAAG